jgi:lysophospholipid acyltransferase (LPLAT)-like uncharacterized protein
MDKITKAIDDFNEESGTKATPNSGHWQKSRQFTLWQRIQILLIGHISAAVVYLLGRTLRWESRGDENLECVYRAGQRAILVFWHGRIFTSTWYFRKRGIVVMTSQNFDGEYIGRCIKLHGYNTARGSSSRGGVKALGEMAHWLKKGLDVAFTIDGPRGPRYVAKMGPVILAKKTGQPIVCFHISTERKIQLNSWDLAQIPLPFSRALILKAEPIYVSRQADEAEVERCFQQMQAALDRLREEADACWAN